MKSWEHKKECVSDLEAAENIGKRDLSKRDRVLVEEERVKRIGKLAQAEKELGDANDRCAEAERMLADGETYFARSEIINFCRSRRYTLNPLNTANALAGLTRVGWRRSMDLCQKEEPVSANKGRIQIFNSILRMVRSCTRKSELLKHAERWLKQAPTIKAEDYGVSELRDNWFYLLWAIKDTLKAKVRSRDLPFAITQEYWKRKENGTDVERFLAAGERIVV